MNKAIGLALIIGGAILLIFGIQASHSFTSDVSRTFTGNPTNQSVWMIVGGAVAAIVGLALAFRSGTGPKL